MQNVAEYQAEVVEEEVIGMSHNPVCGRPLTVILVPKVEDDLGRLQQRTKLSPTDLTNRAITMYEFIDGRAREGHEMLTRDKKTGRTELVEFLGVGCGPGDTDEFHFVPAGHLDQPRRSGRHRSHRSRRVHHSSASGHDRPRRVKGRLAAVLFQARRLLRSLAERFSIAGEPTL